MWMEQGCVPCTVRFDLLASLAPTSIAISILYHVHPPVSFQQCCPQLLWPGVSHCREVMLKLEDCLSGLLWYPSGPSLSPESHLVSCPLIIKPLWLLYMCHTIFLE